ncbi:MAG: hypothetical protein V9H25_22565 [Candidatus Competibacter sp.]
MIQSLAKVDEAIPTELPESLGALALRCRAWSLGQSGRHEEAIGTARDAADLGRPGGGYPASRP